MNDEDPSNFMNRSWTFFCIKDDILLIREIF